jgi:hypothetical protein
MQMKEHIRWHPKEFETLQRVQFPLLALASLSDEDTALSSQCLLSLFADPGKTEGQSLDTPTNELS